ncbi:hypothetical protein I3843_05G044200 [Carya illinoinensis]|nr:hypothetical protein I3843_05G044200 [Carya illinoinensis]
MNDLFYQMRIEHLTMYQILVLDVKLIDANILYIKFYNCCRTFMKIIKGHHSDIKCTQQQKHSHMQTLERKEQKSANTCMHTCSSATHMQTIHTHIHTRSCYSRRTPAHTRWKLTHAKSRKALGRYSRAAGEEMHNTHAKQTHSDTTHTNS